MTWDYFYIFWQSNLLEVLIYAFFYRKTLSVGSSFLLVTSVNSITHPVVLFGFMHSSLSYLVAILAAEAFAIVAETGVHSYAGRMPWPRTLLAAFSANLVSWQVAPALTYWLFLK